ncbi:MAG: hypothetical protein JW860_13480, partial [Sedimentisphaerales bacterium]|nr:hypothetical protein [Sedimentisphaerales bacterium]
NSGKYLRIETRFIAYSLPFDDNPIIAKWGSAADSDDEWILDIKSSDQKLHFQINSSTSQGSPDTILISSIIPSLGDWHEVVAIWDGNAGTAYLYLDDLEVASTTSAITVIPDLTQQVSIGYGHFGSGYYEYFDGQINDTRIISSGQNIVAEWTFDECGGSTALDSSGNNNHGTIYNAVYISDTIYVDTDAIGNNDGTSWEDAYNYLQDALNDMYLSTGDEIRVAQGTYKPDEGAGVTPGDRNATFQLINGVALMGGYAGYGEVDPDLRDPNIYVTILSGDIGTPDNNSDNSYHVVTGSGTDATAIMDGFVITKGNGYDGAGMICDSGSPVINNCTFIANTASHWGGGIYCVNNSTASINNCRFEDNSSASVDAAAGGIGVMHSSPSIMYCEFISNTANGDGGGICNGGYSYPIISRCIFKDNFSGYGGGVNNNDNSDPYIINCIFTGNTSSISNSGGGICNAQSSSPTIINCIFNGNNGYAIDYYGGTGSTTVLKNCILWDDSPAEINLGGSTALVTYCDIQGGYSGTGNINSDPLFVDPGNDYHLLCGSPCIDTGTDAGVYEDIEGNIRPLGDGFDMGAYEHVAQLLSWYVDTITGDNSDDGLTRETAFETIQKGIETACDGDTVLVWPGVYVEDVNFLGKAITVTSAADAAHIVAETDYAVSFDSAEEDGSVLENFVIRDSYAGVRCLSSSPTIKNVTVVNNDNGILADGGATPEISNSILWNNAYADMDNCSADDSWVQKQLGDSVDGLVAYWSFDDPCDPGHDDSGYEHDGIVNGAVPIDGVCKKGLSFDGVDDDVDIPQSIFALPTSAVTVSAWFISNKKDGSGWSILDQYGGRTLSLRAGPIHGPDDDGIEFGIADTTGTWFFAFIPENEWEVDKLHHVVGTYDGNIVKIYLDGNLMDSNPDPDGAMESHINELSIGHYYGTIHYWFEGMIDEVQIYSRALSGDEILAMYENGIAGFCLGNPIFGDEDNDDYHLKSEKGRFYPEDPGDPNMFGMFDGAWLFDVVTSPCIDSGDPNEDPGDERMPNGGRINQGAYGGTAYASMSQCLLRGDINKDGIVNLEDFAIMSEEWLMRLPWVE